MSNVEKKKLCWNCEGSVLRSVSNCPYCGVYIYPEEEEEEDANSRSRPIDPPYKPQEFPKDQIPQAPYAQPMSAAAIHDATDSQERPLTQQTANWKMIMAPLFFLLSGSVFFLFGFLMLLFSNNGLFTLQWNANYWYLYLLVSVPFLYFGWHTLESIQE